MRLYLLVFSLFYFQFLILPKHCQAALKGDYTINPVAKATAGNYKTLQAALDDIRYGKRLDGGPVNGPGLNNDTRLVLADGTYFWPGIFNGKYAGSNYTVHILSASENSQNVTLLDSGKNAKQAIFVGEKANIRFSNVSISHPKVSVRVLSDQGSARFENCTLRGDILASGNISLSMKWNNITGQVKAAGINSDSLIYVNMWYNTITTRNAAAAVDIDLGHAPYLYFNNISLGEAGDLLAEKGVNLSRLPAGSFSSKAEILNNRIWVKGASTVSGISLENIQDEANVFNNIVSVRQDKNESGPAIWAEDCKDLKIYFTNLLNASSKYPCISLKNSKVTIKNTIAANASIGGAMSVEDGFIESDHNDWFSFFNATPIRQTLLGKMNTYSLANWQRKGQDLHSYDVDPQYNSVTELVTANPWLNRSETNLKISLDLNSQLRSNPPDIGAYEFEPARFSRDAALVSLDGPQECDCLQWNKYSVVLQNAGKETLTEIKLHHSLNGKLQPIKTFSFQLKPDEKVSLPLDSFENPTGSPLILKVWTSSPNDGQDEFARNDTMVKKFSASTRQSYVKWNFTYVPDKRGIQYKFEFKGGDFWIWDFGDGTSNNENSGIHYYEKEGEYRLKLKIYRPGYCVTEVDSLIHIKAPSGISSTTTNADMLLIFPNPAANAFTINLPIEMQTSAGNLCIYDYTAKLVYVENYLSGEKSITLNPGFLPGLYLVRISSAGGKTTTGRLLMSRPVE